MSYDNKLESRVTELEELLENSERERQELSSDINIMIRMNLTLLYSLSRSASQEITGTCEDHVDHQIKMFADEVKRIFMNCRDEDPNVLMWTKKQSKVALSISERIREVINDDK